MSCVYSIESGPEWIKCEKKGICPYQYFCNKRKRYVSTAGPEKCKFYTQKTEEKKNENK